MNFTAPAIVAEAPIPPPKASSPETGRKCKKEKKVVRCASRRLQLSSGRQKEIKKLCRLGNTREIEDVRVQLVKQDKVSKPCINKKSFRLLKRKGRWHLEVRNGCRGKFKIRYRRKIYDVDCSRKCGPNAVWKKRRRGRGGKCRCKRGYRGNPKKGGCTASCVCRASGDPHYSTYDGQKIHFMGTCKYTLTRTLGKQPCAFNIMVYNERRNNKKSVSYTKQVDVEIGNNRVSLFKGKISQVNERNVNITQMPFEKDGILLTTVGRRFVKLQSPSCGLTVLWDGKHSVEVSADKGKYGGKMTGICGDCNGKRDDFRLANGTNVSRLPAKEKYREIGDSYRVTDAKSPISACGPTPAFSSCTPEQTKRFSSNEACGLMESTSDENPFKECVKWMKTTKDADGNSPFSSCLIDACNNDGAKLKTVTCPALEEFEEICVENGYAPPEDNIWRNITSCSLAEVEKCHKNEEYVEDGSGCPNTCLSPKAEETCSDPDVAGCQCKKGFVRDGDICIPVSQCGCTLLKKRVPVNSSILSVDCKQRISCTLRNGVPKVIEEPAKCRTDEICLNLKGRGECKKAPAIVAEAPIPPPKASSPETGRKCKKEKKVVRCASRRLQLSSGRQKEIKKLCRLGNTREIEDVRVQLVKQDKVSKPCINKKSFRLLKRKGRWHLEVRNGCRGKFKIRYRRKIYDVDCSRKCGPNAVWKKRRRGRGGKCRCKRGYRGNPKKGGCTASCVCRASGDPHYSTYDGQKIHFMGTCKYTLTRTLGKQPCAFNIMVYNERRNNKKSVSYTKQVDVEIGNNRVSLFKGKISQVNERNVNITQMPFEKDGILLTTVGRRFVKLQSPSCGLTVLWDGKHSVEVSADKGKYGGKMTGICGDCNGKRDDFRLANGTNVSRLPAKEKYREIGDSYRVTDAKSPISACGPTPAFSSCTPEQTKRFSSNEACGLMESTSDENPFKECVKWMKTTKDADGNSPFSSCLIDACNNDGAKLKTVTCPALEEFEEICVENGYAPPEDNIWRNITSCSLTEVEKCHKNEEYVEDGSGCPNTCLSPKAEETCSDPDVAGCQCKKGFVRDGDICIPVSQCGCTLLKKRVPVNSSILSVDCKQRISCTLRNGVPKVIEEPAKCRTDEICLNLKGRGECKKAPAIVAEAPIPPPKASSPETGRKCKKEKKVVRCASRRLQLSSGRQKEIKKLCRLGNTREIEDVRVQLVKQDKVSKPCINKKSFRLLKRKGRWHLEVRNGCRGKFKIRYRRKIYDVDCSRKCGPNAVWKKRRRGRGGKCRCKRGYRGNPKKGGCTASCVCRASGDPHYSTYDGQKIHFMGTCKYTLTRTLGKQPCAFNIMVYNERRNNKKSVSYTKQVDVEIGNNRVSLFKGKISQVNERNVNITQMPFEKDGILLTTVGRRFVKLQSPSCGLTVLWDGKHSVEVSADKGKYGGKMTGICGDCNGKRDDFRLANGTNVSRLPAKEKYREIGDSYRVTDAKSPISACGPTPAFSSCTPEQTKRFSSNEACGLMESTSDENPFKECVKWMKTTKDADGNSPFSSCLIDACNNDGAKLKTVTCPALEEFEEICVENGYAPPEDNIWRNITSCSLAEVEKCHKNEEYVEDGSGCPNTCLSPKAEETCSDPDVAGCQCKKGFVRDGDICIPVSQCGCTLLKKRVPVNSSILSVDCKQRISCTLRNGVPKVIEEPAKCRTDEICLNLKGRGECKKAPAIVAEAPIPPPKASSPETGRKCKKEKKVVRCASRRLQLSSGRQKEIKKLCRLGNTREIEDVRVQLVKQDKVSKPCINKKSFRLLKRKGRWHLEVRNGCRGKFKIRYRRKSKISNKFISHSQRI
ncbi:IgGFc-binding protein-like [Saccostrea echinata]|uniref:IgGFc-binding protein-like n=1 Tax=Saccostrea echinata TaxID=191078 RepID=UPI002A82141D|nr:IgGFc-binding protein-like [Saccostrea echinata]